MPSLRRGSLGDLPLCETGVVRSRTEEYLSTALQKWVEHTDILKKKNLNYYLAEVKVTLHEEGLEKYDMVILLHKPFNHCTKYTEAMLNYRTK